MWPSERTRAVLSEHEAAAWRHIRFKPTRLGGGLLLMVGLLWLVGLNYQANLAYVAAFWLFGFIIAAALYNLRQLLGLRLVWQMPSEIFAGTPAEFTVEAEGKPCRRWLWLQQGAQGPWRAWTPADGLSVTLPVAAQRRGYLGVPELRVVSTAPFGISMVEAVWQWRGDEVVFPAPLVHEPPPAVDADNEQDVRMMMVQSSDDLSHLQAHQEGTSLQHVAWKAYAKTGEMLDKRFEAAVSGGGSDVISYRDYPDGADKEQLAGWLCFRVLEAERSGRRYELALPGHTITPQKGQREIGLTALALW